MNPTSSDQPNKNIPLAGPLDGPSTNDELRLTERTRSMDFLNGLVIGIGDLHGHAPAQFKLFNALQEHYDIFSDRKDLILYPYVDMVYTGDYIDRGNSGLRVIKTVQKIHENNPDNVTPLLGNHELLALGCLNRAEMALYSEEYFKYYNNTIHGYNGGDRFVKEFGWTRGQQFRNYVQRMSKEGDIGRWLRSLAPIARKIVYDKKVLFVHGGIPRDLNDEISIDRYLEQFQEHVDTYTHRAGGYTRKYIDDPMVGEESVFWDRSFVLDKNMSCEAADKIVKGIEVDYIVIGHSVNKGVDKGRIANIGGRIFDIDVGMSPVYGKNEPTAIVFKKEGIFAFYARRGEEQLVRF